MGLAVAVISFFIWFFKVQMGRMQPVVMAPKNPVWGLLGVSLARVSASPDVGANRIRNIE